MTQQQVNKIKRTLKKEGINRQTYFNGETLKVILIDRPIGDNCSEEYKKEIINVLSALSKNGLRPEYKKAIVRRTNAIWTYDQYSIIFS
jgi:hypothetical protein